MNEKQLINKLSELLTKYEKQNQELKDKRKFNMTQANNTMKRFGEDFGSWVIKEWRLLER